MPVFRVRFVATAAVPDSVVEADEVAEEGGFLVFRRVVLVVGRPRPVVALRVAAATVRDVSVDG